MAAMYMFLSHFSCDSVDAMKVSVAEVLCRSHKSPARQLRQVLARSIML